MTNVTTRSPSMAVSRMYSMRLDEACSTAFACMKGGHSDAASDRAEAQARRYAIMVDFLDNTENVECEVYAIAKLYAAWIMAAPPVGEHIPEPTKADSFVAIQMAAFRARFPKFADWSDKDIMGSMAAVFETMHNYDAIEPMLSE